MKHATGDGHEFTVAGAQCLERRRRHPELRARCERILELPRPADGPLKTADAVEEQFIQELRPLGQTSMNQWAAQAEQRVSGAGPRGDAPVRSRKRKRCRGGVSLGW